MSTERLAAFFNNSATGFMEYTQLSPITEEVDGVLTEREATEEEVAAEMQRLHKPYNGISPISIIPQDELSAFYNGAHFYESGVVKYNLIRARAIKLRMVREMRAQLFPVVDAMRARAVESGSQEEMQNVARIANAMRDLPSTAGAVLEAAGDIGAIHAYAPAIFAELMGGQ